MTGTETILKLLKCEPYEKEFTFGEVKVKLKTLLGSQREEVIRRVIAMNPVATAELVKKPYLGYSLVAINGTPINAFPEIFNKMAAKVKDEDRKPLNILIEEDIIEKMSAVSIDILYGFYDQLEKEEYEFKVAAKNSSADHSVEHSGDSSGK